MLLGQMTSLYSCIISILSEYRSFPCFVDAEDDYKNEQRNFHPTTKAALDAKYFNKTRLKTGVTLSVIWEAQTQ